jgi:fimbrial chaperone protein
MGTTWAMALAGATALACLPPGEARATSLEITPVAVHLVPGAKATTIEVANRGGVPAAIQLRAYAWSQDGNKDGLTPTQDILLSPPIFTLGTDRSQTIRLMLRRGASAAGERTYRLLIDEVPATNPKAQQVQVAMRLSLPLIVGSVPPKTRALQWRAMRGANGQVTLSATNVGSAFERVQSIAVTTADGSAQTAATDAANSYILAGAERRWTIPAAANARQVRISVTTRTGTSEQVLAIAQ